MSIPIIKVERLSKAYTITHQNCRNDGFRHLLEDAICNSILRIRNLYKRTTLGRARAAMDGSETFWALQDISFEIMPGEVVGFIGRNGAGKSTLLKILSRISPPTSGKVSMQGRVASLLEVGTGFHPELTGRENIFLNGAVLGMSRREIKRKFDEIVDFAEVERFLDTPVKRYSSGMYVRLAFAVAAHLDPEILIVDEVLAVGDSAFQKKCLGKISQAAKGGRTVLFVSHNMGVVNALCDRVIMLVGGEIVSDGEADSVIPIYMKIGSSAMGKNNVVSDDALITFLGLNLIDDSGNHRSNFHTQESVYVTIDFEIHFEVSYFVNPVLDVQDEYGNSVFTTSNFNERHWFTNRTRPGCYRSICEIPADVLNDRSYSVGILFCRNATSLILHVESVAMLDIIDSGQYRDVFSGPRRGLVRPPCRWETSRMVPEIDLNAS